MLIAVSGAACSNDGPPEAASASPVVTDAGSDEAAAAEAICTALKDQANAMSEIANESVRTINTLSPDERVGAILDGFDAAAVAVTAFLKDITVLEVPAIIEREAILLEIASGAGAALDELADEHARFVEEAGVTINDADVQGRVGQFFNSIEKVNSLVEPVIARYERVELQRVFLDAEPCEHVIQPFRVDE